MNFTIFTAIPCQEYISPSFHPMEIICAFFSLFLGLLGLLTNSWLGHIFLKRRFCIKIAIYLAAITIADALFCLGDIFLQLGRLAEHYQIETLWVTYVFWVKPGYYIVQAVFVASKYLLVILALEVLIGTLDPPEIHLFLGRRLVHALVAAFVFVVCLFLKLPQLFELEIVQKNCSNAFERYAFKPTDLFLTVWYGKLKYHFYPFFEILLPFLLIFAFALVQIFTAVFKKVHFEKVSQKSVTIVFGLCVVFLILNLLSVIQACKDMFGIGYEYYHYSEDVKFGILIVEIMILAYCSLAKVITYLLFGNGEFKKAIFPCCKF